MINHYLSILKKSPIYKNILTLISGTIFAQLIPILLQPILRRLYSPEDFGAYAIYLTSVGILSVLCSLRYEQAIIMPANDNEAVNVFSLSIFFTAVFSFLLLLIIIFFKVPIAGIIKFPMKYMNWLILLPFSVLFVSCYEAMNYWLIRKKQFRSSSLNKISKRGVEGITLLAFGVARSHTGLFWGDLTGNSANIFSGVYQMKKSGFKIKYLSKLRLRYSFKKYNDFPKYNLFPNFLNTISGAVPVFFINNYYTKTTVGHFDLSRQALSIPAALITASIFQVLYQRISESFNRNISIKNEIKDLFMILSLISFIEIITVFFFGTPIFKFVFGSQWSLSGEYSRLLVFSYAVKFIVSPLSAVFIPLGKIKIGSLWQVFYFLAISIFFFLKDIPFERFLKYYVLFDIFSYSLFLALITYVIKDYEKKIAKK